MCDQYPMLMCQKKGISETNSVVCVFFLNGLTIRKFSLAGHTLQSHMGLEGVACETIENYDPLSIFVYKSP